MPPLEELLEDPLDDLAERRVSEQVLNAFEGFFENREGIQDRFLPVWKRVIERYADRAEVIGFQPMNEPLVSHFDLSQGLLHDFYKKLVPPMRELDARHALWMEPGVIRHYLNSAPCWMNHSPTAISFTARISTPAVTYEQWKAWLVENYSNMQEEANSWGGALVVGEWGTHPDSPEAKGYIRAQQEVAEELSSGQIYWLWKEASQDSWGFYDFEPATQSWIPRESAVRLFSTPYAQAVPGTLVTHKFDFDTGVLAFSFEATGNEWGGAQLYLPELWFPDSPTILVNGNSVAYERDPSSQRVLFDLNLEPGRVDVEVY